MKKIYGYVYITPTQSEMHQFSALENFGIVKGKITIEKVKKKTVLTDRDLKNYLKN